MDQRSFPDCVTGSDGCVFMTAFSAWRIYFGGTTESVIRRLELPDATTPQSNFTRLKAASAFPDSLTWLVARSGRSAANRSAPTVDFSTFTFASPPREIQSA